MNRYIYVMMKKALAILIGIILCKITLAQSLNADSIYLKQVSQVEISTTNFNKLLPLIINSGKNDEEKLTLVYYWVYSHINFDMERFIKVGPLQPLNLSETLKSGKGMCYEYNEFIDAACKYLKIPGYHIEGYVKYYGFEVGQPFTENNHIWYTVYMNGKWRMIDMLWACGTLHAKADGFEFTKRLHKKYFLANPADFAETHLPADPVWQFENHPLTMTGFINKAEGVDTTQRSSFINYADSISVMNKLNPGDQELKGAIRAYHFNSANPNQLIVVYYNDAVNLVNNIKATKNELQKAKKYFWQARSLISKSTDTVIKSLAAVCDKGVLSIENRLKYAKD